MIGAPQTQRLRCCLEVRGDNFSNPFRSDLRLWINDQELGPPHIHHVHIRAEGGGRFSHWDDHIIFSLPPGTENQSTTRLKVRFSTRPRWGAGVLLPFIYLVLAITLYRPVFTRALSGWSPALGRLPTALLGAVSALAVVACGTYAASVAYAWLSGWALPTTAIFRWSSTAEWLARQEPTFGHLLIACAVFGFVVRWVTSDVPRVARHGRRDDLVFTRLFSRYGWLVIASAFVFSMSAMWAGIARDGDIYPHNIGGLIAFSDAQSYLGGAHDQAKNGVWNGVIQNRPLAAAFRSVLLWLSGFSPLGMLLLQAVVVAAASTFAASAVARWRGIWAGLAFLGLTYIYVREFVPTSLTELLGLAWALLSLPFFIEMLRTQSLPHGLVALAMMTAALLTRMGSMFTIPALIVWMIWVFAHDAKRRIGVAVVALCVVAGVAATSLLLEKAFGDGHNITGGNFSLVLCGITVGKDWTGCQKTYEEENAAPPRDNAEVSRFLYSKALENFRRDPQTTFKKLFANAQEFVGRLPDLIWKGYLPIETPPWLPRTQIVLLGLLGLAFTLAKRREASELSFWIVLLASVTVSAAVVFADDGQRVLAVSYPLIWLLLSSGLAAPPVGAPHRTKPDTVLLRQGRAMVVLLTMLLLAGPWLAHRLAPRPAIANVPRPPADQHLVFGPPRMTGFLIVADGTPLRKDVPSLHLSDFARMLKQGYLENYQSLLNPQAPSVPFGFVAAPRVEKGVNTYPHYIVPAEVMERRDVPFWRFEVINWHLKPAACSGLIGST